MIFHIMKKQVKLAVRNKNYIIFTLIFPLALIFVLGNVLSASFSEDQSPVKLQIAYEKAGTGTLHQAFTEFAKQAGSKDVRFIAVKSEKNGKAKVASAKYSAFVATDNDKLTVFTNYPQTMEKTVIDSYISAFSSQYSLIKGTAAIAPGEVEKVMQAVKIPKDAIQVDETDSSKAMSSFEFYAIAMISMTMMLGVTFGINSYRIEKVKHTDIRLVAAPIRKLEVMTGNFLGEFAIQIVGLIILMLVSQFLFGVNWGSYAIFIFLVYFSLALFSVFLGMALDIFTNGNPAVAGASTIIVMILAFIGGSYFPMISPTVQMFSPIGWANISVRELLYNHNLSAMFLPILGNLGLTIILLGLVVWHQKRREAI
ncbi:ABC transporter permease [Listeria floridensis FSL S10-1187]|uniref:ABC transporter permease n=1 Tax=Listeria floridensis FSL S10-1187 TaxID=1265817 RepID=A0ABN0RHU2_9LIST|nr:ABC transporter permease [Listeria floridensis]EUJ33473.1 ABC transporter permease [Listeria floridensis FSL S10-1187]